MFYLTEEVVVDVKCGTWWYVTVLSLWMFALAHALLQMAPRAHLRHSDIRCKTNRRSTIINICKMCGAHKTPLFSVMILDQYHEQNNANVKDSGNQWAFRCWMVAGHKLAICLEVEEQAPY